MAYEKYTYEQIKELPEELKTTVLKELKEKFPVNTDLAKHLNVAPVVTSNLMKKYVDGIQVGRKKMTPEEKAHAKAARELKKQQEQTNNTITQPVVTNQEPIITNPEPIVTPIKEPENYIKTKITNNSRYNIEVEKTVEGEEISIILNGIASTLLKESKYRISMNIEEA